MYFHKASFLSSQKKFKKNLECSETKEYGKLYCKVFLQRYPLKTLSQYFLGIKVFFLYKQTKRLSISGLSCFKNILRAPLFRQNLFLVSFLSIWDDRSFYDFFYPIDMWVSVQLRRTAHGSDRSLPEKVGTLIYSSYLKSVPKCSI